MSGFYAMYYTGTAGSGFAVFIMKDGVIAGADPLGGVLDGSYEEAADGNIEIAVSLAVPSGTSLVTGTVVGQEPMAQEIKGTFPANFADGNALPVRTPTGPVNVIFKRLRDLP